MNLRLEAQMSKKVNYGVTTVLSPYPLTIDGL